MKVVQASLVLVFSFLFWGLVSAVLGYGFLSVAPCHWFGSSFEGACGYRAFSLVLTAVVMLTFCLAIVTVIVFLRMSGKR